MRNEIKPCECGSVNFYVANPMAGLYQVFCLNCGNTSPMGYSENGAIDEWNKSQKEATNA